MNNKNDVISILFITFHYFPFKLENAIFNFMQIQESINLILTSSYQNEKLLNIPFLYFKN